MCGCFEFAGLFSSSLQKEAYTSAILQKQPQKHGNGKKPTDNYEQAKARNCAGATVLCVP